MNILFFGDQWDDTWRRRQQLAWRLTSSAPVRHVVYVERPLTVVSLVKFLTGTSDYEATLRWRRLLSRGSDAMPVGNKLTVLTPIAPISATRSRLFYRGSEQLRDRWLFRRLRTQFRVDGSVVWVSHPQLSVRFIRTLEPRVLWYDCTEDFAAVPGLAAPVKEQIQETDAWLTRNAGVVSAVSTTLYEEKRLLNPNTLWLPNGVDADLFARSEAAVVAPAELGDLPRPVLVFVGGLNEWAHDWDLLDRVAGLRPKWTFALVGALEVSKATESMLRRHPNIVCAGQKRYKELPAYVAAADVCFQFYRPCRGNDTRNSQKLFIFFSAGKPVVSTQSADAHAYSSDVYMADTPEEFVASVERACAEDSPQKAVARKRIAAANSWAQISEAVLTALKQSAGQDDAQ